MIKTISFYDFDGTLMDSPLPEAGKQTWFKKTGKEYPHIGWWGKPESLDINVFDIKPFPSILDQLKRDTAKSDTYTVMLTSRIEKLRPYIEKILDHYNIKFDELSFKDDERDKDGRIKEYLKGFPDVETINIYDDRDKEIKVFSRLKNDIGDQYHINIYRVTNGNYSLVEGFNILEKLIFDEMSKLYKNQEL